MVRTQLEGAVRLSLLALACLHLTDVLIHASWLKWGIYAVLVFILIAGLFITRGVTLILSSLTLIVGHLLLFLHGSSFREWGEAITKNLPLLSLLILVPLIQIPFQAGGYLNAVEDLVRQSFDTKWKVVTVFGSVVFLIGSLLNLGGLRFLSRVLRGLSLNLLTYC